MCVNVSSFVCFKALWWKPLLFLEIYYQLEMFLITDLGISVQQRKTGQHTNYKKMHWYLYAPHHFWSTTKTATSFIFFLILLVVAGIYTRVQTQIV